MRPNEAHLPAFLTRRDARAAKAWAFAGLLPGAVAMVLAYATIGSPWGMVLPLGIGIIPAGVRGSGESTWPLTALAYLIGVAISVSFLPVTQELSHLPARRAEGHVFLHLAAVGLCAGAAVALSQARRGCDGMNPGAADGAVMGASMLSFVATMLGALTGIATGSLPTFLVTSLCGAMTTVVFRVGKGREERRGAWLQAVVAGGVTGYAATRSEASQADAVRVPPLLYRDGRTREAAYSLVVTVASVGTGAYREHPDRPGVVEEIGSLPSDFATNPEYLTRSMDSGLHTLRVPFAAMVVAALFVFFFM